MRHAKTTILVPAVLLACSFLITACGGGGDDAPAPAQAQVVAQSISFTYSGGVVVASPPTALVATATSGLPVAFTSNTPAVCTVAGSMLTAVSPGECSITAEQQGGPVCLVRLPSGACSVTSGQESYAAATPVIQVFDVPKLSQLITFSPPASQELSNGSVQLVATANSGLVVSFTSGTPVVCTVSGTMVSLLSNGDCSITAAQAGNGTYAAAPAVTRVFAVATTTTAPEVLTFMSGYTSDQATVEGLHGGSAGSNFDGWWCDEANWCGSSGQYSPAVSAAASSFTWVYRFQTNDPAHVNTDGWIGGYVNVNMLAPGLASLSTTGDSAGMQLTNQTTLTFSLGQNSEWFSTVDNGAPANGVFIDLVLGHFQIDATDGNKPCNIRVRATILPATAAVTTYNVPLADFTTISKSCGLSGLNAAAEVAAYPVSQLEFGAVTFNRSVAGAAGSGATDPSYPTAITMRGGITFH